MDDELQLSNEEYDHLPADPERRFVALEAQVRSEMNRLIATQQSSWSDTHLRRQYASLISGYAEALGIDGVAWERVPEDDDEAQAFMFNATRVAARIKAKGYDTEASVRLGQGSRKEIEAQIAVLKHLVDAHVPDERQRHALLKHLEEIRKELGSDRIDLAKVLVVLGRVAFALTTGTTFLAETPHAIATITSILGRDKIAEEVWQKHIGATPRAKALPAPERKKVAPSRLTIADDDIPF